MKFELDSEQIRIKLREIFDSQSDFKLKSIRKAGQLYVLGLSSKESVMHPADRLNLLFVNWGENFDLIKLKKTVRSGGFRRREYVPRESHYRGMRNLFATFLFRDGWLAQVPESGEAGEDEKETLTSRRKTLKILATKRVLAASISILIIRVLGESSNESWWGKVLLPTNRQTQH